MKKDRKLGKKEIGKIRAVEPEPNGARCFWILGAGAGWEKNQEPEPKQLKKKESLIRKKYATPVPAPRR